MMLLKIPDLIQVEGLQKLLPGQMPEAIAAMVQESGLRLIAYPASVIANPAAEVHIFKVHEISLVETSSLLKNLPSDAQCSPGEPVNTRVHRGLVQ